MKRSAPPVNVGIDVGRDRLDVFIRERQLPVVIVNPIMVRRFAGALA
jgi:hypothetical protein